MAGSWGRVGKGPPVPAQFQSNRQRTCFGTTLHFALVLKVAIQNHWHPERLKIGHVPEVRRARRAIRTLDLERTCEPVSGAVTRGSREPAARDPFRAFASAPINTSARFSRLARWVGLLPYLGWKGAIRGKKGSGQPGELLAFSAQAGRHGWSGLGESGRSDAQAGGALTSRAPGHLRRRSRASCRDHEKGRHWRSNAHHRHHQIDGKRPMNRSVSFVCPGKWQGGRKSCRRSNYGHLRMSSRRTKRSFRIEKTDARAILGSGQMGKYIYRRRKGCGVFWKKGRTVPVGRRDPQGASYVLSTNFGWRRKIGPFFHVNCWNPAGPRLPLRAHLTRAPMIA